MFRPLKPTFLTLAILHSAQAAPLVNFTPTGFASSGDARTWGWAFSTSRTLYVDAIGFFDNGSNGLAQSHEVGLWDVSGTLLASAVIGNSNVLQDKFRYSTLSSILVLAPGTYTLAGFNPTGGGDGVAALVTPTLAPGVTYLGNRDIVSPTFQFPASSTSSFNNSFFSVNLNLVPELNAAGSAWSLALTGTLFALLSSRRRDRAD